MLLLFQSSLPEIDLKVKSVWMIVLKKRPLAINNNNKSVPMYAWLLYTFCGEVCFGAKSWIFNVVLQSAMSNVTDGCVDSHLKLLPSLKSLTWLVTKGCYENWCFGTKSIQNSKNLMVLYSPSYYMLQNTFFSVVLCQRTEEYNTGFSLVLLLWHLSLSWPFCLSIVLLTNKRKILYLFYFFRISYI